MYIANIIDDYTDFDNITTICNCTNNDNNIKIIIPLYTINPCDMSLMCLIPLMVDTKFKPLFNKK